MGQKWLDVAATSFRNPIVITIPYSEKGYFSDTKPNAVSYSFTADKGENISFEISTNPHNGFSIFSELWYIDKSGKSALLFYADTPGVIRYNTKTSGTYIFRLQPELLRSCSYTLSIISGSVLTFPVSKDVKSKIGSFWGDGRDGGSRKHEGIDIFAPRRSPAVAAASGYVTKTGENKLGGKVVWIRTDAYPLTLYYAHLDSQLVTPGMYVKEGEPVGLIGNTGNASKSSPHLHFGIYTTEGAIDPLPWVKNGGQPKPITADTTLLNILARSIKPIYLYSTPNIKDSIFWIDKETLLEVNAATDNWYRVTMPDGKMGYIPSLDVTDLSESVANISIDNSNTLYEAPDDKSIAIKTLEPNTTLMVLGGYNNFLYVKNESLEGWIKPTN
jgi:murein DD-endopeptidase MepM/ murein hydrolase activator NlpD